MSTILIIEDDINLAELIKERLEKKGYKIIVAYTGSSGIVTAFKTKPDVITLDIHLPDISGVDVLKMLKKDKDKSSIPVIVVTCDETIEKECREYKVDEFVKKPINFNKLEKIIELVAKKNNEKIKNIYYQ
ncbi:MAG: response regulator [Elusimicrobiota bacterium]|nr:response regulator [Elusimicrobiota bacterium]